MADIAPLKLVETTPGSFSLLLASSALAEVLEVFEDHGRLGDGYAWESIARHLVAREAPALGERVDFDPEPAMFCAYGQDRAALEHLGTMLAALYRDRARLESLIGEALPD